MIKLSLILIGDREFNYHYMNGAALKLVVSIYHFHGLIKILKINLRTHSDKNLKK